MLLLTPFIRSSLSPLRTPAVTTQTRAVSNSPYGRTHVWKRRPPVLPNPVVPKFPQKVIRSDGSSFIHWTTSPRSILRLTRDTTNNPIWNMSVWNADNAVEEESAHTGRLGRFTRRFEELGGDLASMESLESAIPTGTVAAKDSDFVRKKKSKQ